ncbi:MAG TPA: ATP-binding protein [Methanosarcinales archaeon]|nr:ATP-binding protein [Methanosarcinales archaeon]
MTINILKYNHHWKEDFTYGYDKKRDLFYEVVRYSDARQIIGIIGLRRTGKTVLLEQLIDFLIKNGKERGRILYFSFDEETVSLEEVIAEFQSRMGVDLSLAGRTYIFLDEIQKLAGWQNQVKYYYDTYPHLKFFVSGSSSLFLREKAEESLAGRIFLFQLPVLSFSEFLMLKGEEYLTEKPDVFRESLQDQTLQYMRRQLPEIVAADERFVNMYVESIINKIVYEDLPKIFPIEYMDALKQILNLVAAYPGIITDYSTLSNDLGISRKTLPKYVFYLERGFLIQKCYNFSKNRLTSEKKMKRLYLSSTTLLFNLCEEPDYGRAVENLVMNSSQSQFFWRKGNFEVDCVTVKKGSIVPVESKYSSDIRKKEIKGLIKFLKDFSIDTGCVVTRDMETEEMVDGKQVRYVPLWRWLLSEGKTSGEHVQTI